MAKCNQLASLPFKGLRHISSGAAFRDYVVVPEKWHCHIQTH